MAPSLAAASVGSLPSSRAGFPTCSRIGGQSRAARRSLRVLASESGGDLDSQWRDFKQRMKLPKVEGQRVATQAPRFTSSRSSGWNDGPSADQMRRQERAVLNAWTQERFMQLAAGGTMALVLVLLFAAGGPPADPRCTLPWC